jgi:ABC-type Mn2+/Zn2+ transport system permease subunit
MTSLVAITALQANLLFTAVALSLACALLSIVVVLRRWAFIGEGIAHSGFGGAGAAWILMLVVPALNLPWLPYAAVVVFCLITAIAIGALSRGRSIHADAAIGIFLTASLAFGVLAQQIYHRVRNVYPSLFENLLYGQIAELSGPYTQLAVGICLAVVIIIVGLWKEIISYSFDPLLAETSGVPAGLIHYLLMVLLATVIVIGVRVAGSVLVTALLVLPATTALLLSQRLRTVVVISIVVAQIGAVGGVLVHGGWNFLPAGPAIVLVLFLVFVIVWFGKRSFGRWLLEEWLT